MARWKASLGIVPGAAGGAADGPKVSDPSESYPLPLTKCKVTVLTLELASPTLPPGKRIAFDLQNNESIASLKKNPVVIKEGIEYKLVDWFCLSLERALNPA